MKNLETMSFGSEKNRFLVETTLSLSFSCVCLFCCRGVTDNNNNRFRLTTKNVRGHGKEAQRSEANAEKASSRTVVKEK